MASRVLTRSKALAYALSAPTQPRRRRCTALGLSAHSPLSLKTRPPTPPRRSAKHRSAHCLSTSPRINILKNLLGLVTTSLEPAWILGYEGTSRLSGTQIFPLWFSAGASNGSSVQQMQIIAENTGKCLHKGDCIQPNEAIITKSRHGPLTSESLKVRVTELARGATYVMIPALLCTSKNTVTTSLLVMAAFHQIYMFHKEILLDYVHHDVTRKWPLIYFKILLLIMAKDAIVYLDLYPLR